MWCPVVCQRFRSCGEAGRQAGLVRRMCVVCVRQRWPSVSGPWVKLPHGARSGLALVHGARRGNTGRGLVGGVDPGSGAGGRKWR